MASGCLKSLVILFIDQFTQVINKQSIKSQNYWFFVWGIHLWLVDSPYIEPVMKLEQLEHLHSENTPRRSMITHTIDSYWIPSENKTSQSYKFKELAKTSDFFKFWNTSLNTANLQKLLDKMCKYEMDPVSIVEDTERTWFCPQTDRRMAGGHLYCIFDISIRWS